MSMQRANVSTLVLVNRLISESLGRFIGITAFQILVTFICLGAGTLVNLVSRELLAQAEHDTFNILKEITQQLFNFSCAVDMCMFN